MVYLIGTGERWALVDAGWPGDGPRISEAAERIFGPGAAAAAILLTHAHPDHEGDALALARGWGCPVYLGTGELPTARRDFEHMLATAMPLDRWLVLPIMGLLGRRRRQRIFDRASLAPVAQGIEPGTGVPGVAGWECIPSLGHTSGHVSYYRPADRVLLSGDALVTTKIDTITNLLLRCEGLSGPPWYTTWDGPAAATSIARLAELRPTVLGGGHGRPLTGPDTADQIDAFARHLPAARTRKARPLRPNPEPLEQAVTVVNEARIGREPAVVFDYLTDLTREPEWNPKLLAVTPLTSPPLAPGSQFQARFPRPVGPSTITYDQVQRPDRWHTHSKSRWLDVQLTGRISGSDADSHVTLTTRMLPRGPLLLLRPILARTMKRSWDQHLARVRAILEPDS